MSTKPSQDFAIPYGRQSIDDEDIQAVVDILRSDWLTTGPSVSAFEQDVASYCGAAHAVAYSSGTAALHGTMFALDIKSGDEVIVPTMTFAATANCVVYQGGTPVFADVSPDTLLLDPEDVKRKITDRTRAIIGVDYAGQPCDWAELRSIADANGLSLVADACHAIGASTPNGKAGTLADMTVFSFHPVKHITTGEGGMILADDDHLARQCMLFRNHGINTSHRQREESGSWFYEMTDLGYNYRLTDLQCALGASQLRKLDGFLERRNDIARKYDEAFEAMDGITPLKVRNNVRHAYHLYVVRTPKRDLLFKELRQRNIYAQVHYIPVHLHPYYKDNYSTKAGQCPAAEAAYEEILSLPMYPDLTDEALDYVIRTINELLEQSA